MLQYGKQLIFEFFNPNAIIGFTTGHRWWEIAVVEKSQLKIESWQDAIVEQGNLRRLWCYQGKVTTEEDGSKDRW